LKLGDRILKVNGISVDGMTHEQAVDLILSLLQDGDIELLVRHEKQPDGLMKVIIERDNTKKLGITIKGGGPGYRGNPFDPKDDGIFISKITRGEAAEKNGQLRVGHRILEVNDLSLLGVSHIEAVHTLRSVGNSVALLVCNGYSFEDQLKHAQILQLRKPLTGSVDVLDSMEETRDKMKRAYSSASIDVNKRTDVQVIDTGSINLNEVLRELAQFNTEILQIENEKKMIEMISEEADDNDNSEQVSPTALESTSQEELAVTSSEKVKKRSEAQRRTSREVAKQRRQEKKEVKISLA
jgi:protein scribble